ncbi:serine/threonine protein kinase-like protein [Phanerochaete sordida]|uniref:Serine/threonine protein kinase-like protein n=1 Tax=Phanerochaete sordida TaxID=48140 RepID=A0A9P3G0F3_9APHY|nr:serine/threonine protein kinase-like protein [Phanerochaete sordida]
MPNIVPTIESLAGKTVDDGRLLLIDPLGQGSGGVVFRAVDLCSSTPYAVKCMVKADPGSRQATFQQREIALHSRLSGQKNIVTLHRVVEESGHIFLVLDYCAGGDLFKFLTRRGTYVRNDELIRNVMCQLIDGVAHCHERGVFHRDIKPENIMCSRDGTQVKVGDFGLATDSVASRNFGAGTTGYMSPECIGHEMGVPGYRTAANDIWALGVIFTSMISGHNPWRRAVMADSCFSSYIHDPSFLKRMLPISTAANDILVSIFAPAETRVSLPALRAKICAAETFFLSPGELASASKFVRQAAASYVAGVSSASGSSVSSFDALFDDNVADAAQRLIELRKAEGKDALAEHGDEGEADIVVAPGPRLEVPEQGVRPEVPKRPVPPPPQPMPSFRDFMRTASTESSDSESRGHKESSWRAHSPTGLFKRIMDKIFD